MNDPVFQKTAKIERDQEGSLNPHAFTQELHIEHFSPAPQLNQHVDYYWIIDWDIPHAQAKYPEVLLNPHVNIYFGANKCGIQGIHTKAFTYNASGKGRIAGVAFKPGGFYAF